MFIVSVFRIKYPNNEIFFDIVFEPNNHSDLSIEILIKIINTVTI